MVSRHMGLSATAGHCC